LSQNQWIWYDRAGVADWRAVIYLTLPKNLIDFWLLPRTGIMSYGRSNETRLSMLDKKAAEFSMSRVPAKGAAKTAKALAVVIVAALAKAHEVADPATGGLFDRTDCCDLIIRLATLMEGLLAEMESMRQELDQDAGRPNHRLLNLEWIPPVIGPATDIAHQNELIR
jgi:hypothetical protein